MQVKQPNTRLVLRIQVEGVLTFKKRGEALYLDLSETVVDFFPVDTKDSIEGEMTFRGSPGKNIDMKWQEG